MKTTFKNRILIVILAVVAVLVLPLAASAITFTLPVQPDGKQAQVTFTPDFTADTLTIVLEELGVAAVDNADVLTAVFWDMTPNVAPAPDSAIATGNAGPSFVTGDVGFNWQFKTGPFTAPVTAGFGIGTVGDPGFGPTGNFPPAAGTNVDGVSYGIVNGIANGGPATTPVVDGFITFVLDYGSFDLTSLEITNVSFNYSSGVDNRVPLPPSALLLGTGLLGLVGLTWRRKRA